MLWYHWYCQPITWPDVCFTVLEHSVMIPLVYHWYCQPITWPDVCFTVLEHSVMIPLVLSTCKMIQCVNYQLTVELLLKGIPPDSHPHPLSDHPFVRLPSLWEICISSFCIAFRWIPFHRPCAHIFRSSFFPFPLSSSFFLLRVIMQHPHKSNPALVFFECVTRIWCAFSIVDKHLGNPPTPDHDIET